MDSWFSHHTLHSLLAGSQRHLQLVEIWSFASVGSDTQGIVVRDGLSLAIESGQRNLQRSL